MTRTPPAFSADDESAVRALVNEFANTWNRHDMKGMHELDTEDVDWINVAGNHWRGKAAVYRGHDTIHRTVFAKTSMRGRTDRDPIHRTQRGGGGSDHDVRSGHTPTGQMMPGELKTRGRSRW
jgi:hypothetical protein